MRFIENLCQPQIKLLHRIHKESKKHHVRQRARCIFLSYQGFEVIDLARIFSREERTIYTWMDQCETRHFAGLYDKKGRGPSLMLNNSIR